MRGGARFNDRKKRVLLYFTLCGRGDGFEPGIISEAAGRIKPYLGTYLKYFPLDDFDELLPERILECEAVKGVGVPIGG